MRVTVYVNAGRWVARCLRCPAAEHAGPDPVTGHVGGLTGAGFRCGACGLVCGVDWPADVDDIWRVLAQRPDLTTRNWRPPETVEDLIRENLTHGVLPASADALAGHPGGLLLELVDGRIMTGRHLLPALPMPAIEGVA